MDNIYDNNNIYIIYMIKIWIDKNIFIFDG